MPFCWPCCSSACIERGGRRATAPLIVHVRWGLQVGWSEADHRYRALRSSLEALDCSERIYTTIPTQVAKQNLPACGREWPIGYGCINSRGARSIQCQPSAKCCAHPAGSACLASSGATSAQRCTCSICVISWSRTSAGSRYTLKALAKSSTRSRRKASGNS